MHTLGREEIEKLCDDLLGACADEEEQTKLRVMRDMALDGLEARINAFAKDMATRPLEAGKRPADG